MFRLRIRTIWLILLVFPLSVFAQPSDVDLSVWANESMVATYTYSYQNFLERQKAIAHYFTAEGWTAFAKAQADAKLMESVAKNLYVVTAVATLPPEIKSTGKNSWQAVMPMLVVYKNPQYQQKQTLNVTIQFTQVPSGQGVRGLAIKSLQSVVAKPECRCDIEPGDQALPGK